MKIKGNMMGGRGQMRTREGNAVFTAGESVSKSELFARCPWIEQFIWKQMTNSSIDRGS